MKESMARTHLPKSDGLPVFGDVFAGWFLTHFEAQRNKKQTLRSPDLANFIAHLWPVSNEYYSPLNPFLLAEGQKGFGHLGRGLHLVRDGLVPLIWFFKKNPRPLAGKGTLVLPLDFLEWVPRAWRPRVAAYQIESVVPDAGKRKKLFLTSIAMSSFCPLEHLRVQLNELTTIFGREEFAKKEILAFLPTRSDGFAAETRHEFFATFMIEVCKVLGTEIKSVDWRYCEGLSDASDCDVVELNSRLLFSDNWMVHSLASKGARIVPLTGAAPKKLSEKGSRFVAISRYHGLRIWENLPAAAFAGNEMRTTKAQQRFEEAMQSDANRHFPWPSWILEWVLEEHRGKLGPDAAQRIRNPTG